MMRYKGILALGLVVTMMAAGCASQSAAPKEEPAQTEAVQEETQQEPAQEETQQEPAQEEAQQKPAENSAEAATEADQNSETAADQSSEAATDLDAKYESADGWYVMYDSSLIEEEESEDGVSFTYTGKSAGINEITFNYFMNRMPDEILYDAIANDDGLPDHTRSEGYFAGRDDVWAMRVSVTPEEGSDEAQEFIAVEHNGGTLLVQIDSYKEADEATGIKISDTLAAILDSFVFTEHEPQTYSEYVPGKYVQEYEEEMEGKTVTVEYSVELRADHTGLISIQDDVPVIWYSREGILLNAETGEQIYEYVVEGDTLILIDSNDANGEVVTFEFERQ